MNIPIEDIEKYNLTIPKAVLLEYLYKYTDKIDNISVTVVEIIMKDLPLAIPSKRTLFNQLSGLKEVGLITEIEDDSLRADYVIGSRVVELKSRYKGMRCEWCNEDVMTTDKHHYPIRKSEGGQEVVNICPNCHRLFHCLRMFKLDIPFASELNSLELITNK